MAETLHLPRGHHAGVSQKSLLAGLTKDTGEVEFWYDATGLAGIVINAAVQYQGQNPLLGCYLIGTYTGADDENNVISTGSDGKNLKRYGGGGAPGPPFSIRCQRVNARTLQIETSVGPLEQPYKSMSMPLDPVKSVFAAGSFGLAKPGYLVGCGNSWSARSGLGGRFDSIPQPCMIPGAGKVGVARTNRVDPWAEITAPGWGTIRRVVLGGNIVEMSFVNHPGTNNIEYGWVHDPNVAGQKPLPAGAVLTLSEQLTVTPWGAAPAPTPPPPTSAPAFTVAPHVTVTPTTVRLAWQTSPATTATLRGWNAATPTDVYHAGSVVSPWSFTGLTPGTRYQIELSCRDAAGRSVVGMVAFTTPAETPTPPPPPAPTEPAMRITIPSFEVPAAGGTIPVVITATPVGPDPGPGPGPEPMPIPGVHPVKRAGPFIGYGQVNRWPWIDAEALAQALYAAGLTFTAIEWIPWWKSLTDGVGASSTQGGFVTTTYPAEARRFIETMARYSITTFVILRNWNSAAEQQMSEADFRRDLAALSAIVAPPDMLRSGRPVVCVEGVSEPSGGGTHMALNRIVSQEWHGKGGKTLANRVGEQAGPFTWGDFHWCEDFTEATAKAALNNTDCGPVINPGPARSAKMTRAAINRDVGFLVYDFHSAGIDFATIAAMGVEIQKGGKGTYVWDPALLGTGAPPAPGPGQPGAGDMIPIDQVQWVRDNESDVEGFAVTATLTNVRFKAGSVDFNVGGAESWPNGSVDNAPANIFGFLKINGVWYGGTFEWLGAHTTNRRLDHHLGWHVSNGGGGRPGEVLVNANPPRPGDEVGFMVSSVVRGPQRTVNARTPIIVVRMT